MLIVYVITCVCLKKRAIEQERVRANHPHNRHFVPSSRNAAPPREELKPEEYELFFPEIDLSNSPYKEAFNDEVCSVCMDKLESGQKIRKVKFCPHAFHSDCIRDWLKVKPNCPYCQIDLSTQNLRKLEIESKSAN